MMRYDEIVKIKRVVKQSEDGNYFKVQFIASKNQCKVSLPNNGQALESVVSGMSALRDTVLDNVTSIVCSSIYATGKQFYFLIEQDSL